MFSLLPFWFTHRHETVTVSLPTVPETDLALQRSFFGPRPPTAAQSSALQAFRPCFLWTPLHLSPMPASRPSERSWQTPFFAWLTLLKWQLSSNLHDFLAQPSHLVTPFSTGHAAGAAATQAMQATSAAKRRSARRAGAPAEARRAMALGRRGGLGPSLGRRRP